MEEMLNLKLLYLSVECCFFFFFNKGLELCQGLRTLAALAEDPGSVPSTHTEVQNSF